MSEPPENDYEVGYRRPPIETQFKPGQSGNPKGRPKKAKNEGWDEALWSALNEKVAVTRNGKTTNVTKMRPCWR